MRQQRNKHSKSSLQIITSTIIVFCLLLTLVEHLPLLLNWSQMLVAKINQNPAIQQLGNWGPLLLASIVFGFSLLYENLKNHPISIRNLMRNMMDKFNDNILRIATNIAKSRSTK